MAELKKTELVEDFKITLASDQLMFDAKITGTEEPVITHAGHGITKDGVVGADTPGKITATAAADDVVYLDAANQKAYTGDSAENIDDHIFEVDGKKFLFAAKDGIDKLDKKVDIATQDTAKVAMTTIDEAIKKVSAQRSALGAVQNRLKHAIANLDTSAENLQSAESRIRDVDMADEMVIYSKNNILQQAAQSMLAQANQSTQGVLSLLQ